MCSVRKAIIAELDEERPARPLCSSSTASATTLRRPHRVATFGVAAAGVVTRS